MIQLPEVTSYGNYSSENYGAHCLKFTVGELEVWFSYRTPVAFRHPSTGLCVRQNDWGTTTGKHLNLIQPDKKQRITGAQFEQKFQAIRG